MNDLDFSFEAPAWETYLDTLSGSASAAQLLAMLEGESEEDFAEMLDALEERDILLDISTLPPIGGRGESALRLRQEAELAADGLNPADLSENDPLRLYLEEIQGMPPMGDVEALAARCAQGDENAMEALTQAGLGRVAELARAFTGHGVLLLDLIQEGSLGLWQAVRQHTGGSFSPDRRIRISMARIVMEQARENGVGQKLRTALEDYRSVDEHLLGELGRSPTTEELAEALHMPPESAAAIGKMVENARRLQMVQQPPQTQSEPQEEEQAIEDTAYFQLRQRIGDMLSCLGEMEAKVISLRYGLEGGLPASPEETGRRLGLTPKQVAEAESAAMAKMRENG